mmetsp:Transcript_34980/g.40905  ORF Transcript_34980/g.40905 Transcript_34980/m.40905 type:complete len:143 (-) Transcript_34980:195-623(-)
MGRWSEYGSPFKPTNHGYNEDDDTENKARLRAGLNRWFLKNKIQDTQEYKDSRSLSGVFGIYVGPVAGYLFGKFYCDAFTSPKSKYLPKFIKIVAVLSGYKYGTMQAERDNLKYMYKNFASFPVEIQDALKSNDARYLRNLD